MRMQNWDKELLHSLPIDVIFAGFRGNTLGLAQNGWDLSMKQEHTPFGEYCMQLVMKHGGAQLYAISAPVMLDLGMIHGATDSMHRYAEMLSRLAFNIQHVANDLTFRIVPQPPSGVGRFSSQFHPIDPFPQERMQDESIRDFKFFKVSNPELKDIIVNPSQVPELLDMVLKAQATTMKDVRARERSRENTAWVRENMGHHVKPSHIVQAQIITLAS